MSDCTCEACRTMEAEFDAALDAAIPVTGPRVGELYERANAIYRTLERQRARHARGDAGWLQ